MAFQKYPQPPVRRNKKRKEEVIIKPNDEQVRRALTPKPRAQKKRPNLHVRKENVICLDCACVEPINPGNGTPIEAYLIALNEFKERHSRPGHANPFTGKRPKP